MKRRALVPFVLVTVAMVLATYIAWWGVAAAGAIYGAMTFRRSEGPLLCGIAAMAAWAALLAADATHGPVSLVASTLGGVLQVRAIAVYVITLFFPWLLAASAAIVAREVTRMVK